MSDWRKKWGKDSKDRDDGCDETPHDDGCGCEDCKRDLDVVPDEIIEGFRPECGDGLGFVVLEGYLGASPSKGMWRLYRTLELGDYLLVRDKDICRQVTKDDRSRIWLRRRSIVRYVQLMTAEDYQAWFLRGPIAAQRGTGAPAPLSDDPEPGGPDPWSFNPGRTCPQSRPATRCSGRC